MPFAFTIGEFLLSDPDHAERHYLAFLFEQNSWFHVVPFKAAHAQDLEPTWFGTSIARWEGDTLVIEIRGFNGFTRLDTKGNPHSDKMTLTQRVTSADMGHRCI